MSVSTVQNVIISLETCMYDGYGIAIKKPMYVMFGLLTYIQQANWPIHPKLLLNSVPLG